MNEQVVHMRNAQRRGNARLAFVADEAMAYVDPKLTEHPDFHDGWGAVRERCIQGDEWLVAVEPQRAASLVVTDLDAERLARLFERPRSEASEGQLDALRMELAKAAVVDARSVPDDVVTMNSCVVFEDRATGARARLKLVYPKDARRERSALSVLSPVGTALLGLSVGNLLELPSNHALAARLRVCALPYQPEREGHFHM